MEHPREKSKLILMLAVFLLFFIHSASYGEIITKLATNQKMVSLTFDACETTTPSYFDEKILAYLINEKLPFAVFVSGKFAQRNRERISEISKLSFVEIENHSLSHIQHMEGLRLEEIKREVIENEKILKEITNKKTKYFRFPAGNYDDLSLKFVEILGYKVVHWTFPSGDPDKRVTPEKLKNWVLHKTGPGNILIFHINGRGYSTGEALPDIVKGLRKRGFQFIKLEEGLEEQTKKSNKLNSKK